MKILYIDPVAGLSGDMLLSALIDAGYPLSEIETMLKKVPLNPPRIVAERINLGILSGTRIKIEDNGIHLTPKEMFALAEKIEVQEKIKRDVEGMLSIILDAEAKLHGVEREDVHFHELSSIDTFLDFLLVASAIYYFRIDKVFVGAIPHGSGFIETSHGTVPNPPPLTVEILKGFLSTFTQDPYELTTPTGATIVKYYARSHERITGMRISLAGCGVGNYKMTKPDILRVYIGEKETPYPADEVTIIEFDVDDMEMEYTGLFADTLRRCGAIEIVYFPVFMKKGRIGLRFSVISPEEKLDDVIDAVFKNSTTFGLRIRRESRQVLRRDERILKSKYGDVRIKEGYGREGEILKEHIEFDDVKKICEETGLTYTSVLKEVRKELLKEE